MVDSQDRITPSASSFWRLINVAGKLIGMALIVYLAYFYYSLATGKERVSALCQQMTPGMTIERLTQLAQENGLSSPNLNSATSVSYLGEIRSYGRHVCRVEWEKNNTVKQATYSFFD